MEFRRAEREELTEIMTLVDRTFSEQGIPSEMNLLGPELSPEWFVAMDSGRIVGTIASWQENGERHMGRFTVEKTLRGRGTGKALARFALSEIFAGGGEYIVMDGRDATVKVFSAFGARITGARFKFYDDYSTPIRLDRRDFICD